MKENGETPTGSSSSVSRQMFLLHGSWGCTLMCTVLELRVCYLGCTQRCIPHPGQAQVPAAVQAHPWLDNELKSETNLESSCLAHACRLFESVDSNFWCLEWLGIWEKNATLFSTLHSLSSERNCDWNKTVWVSGLEKGFQKFKGMYGSLAIKKIKYY